MGTTRQTKGETLTLRIESSLVARVKREARTRDCSTAMVVRDALRSYFAGLADGNREALPVRIVHRQLEASDRAQLTAVVEKVFGKALDNKTRNPSPRDEASSMKDDTLLIATWRAGNDLQGVH